MTISYVKTVGSFKIGSGASEKLRETIQLKKTSRESFTVAFIDIFFKGKDRFENHFDSDDLIFYFDSKDEPTTEAVDSYCQEIRLLKTSQPSLIVGIGGGSTLDISKAVSNLLANGGKAEDYQGWDLLKKPGVYKIGVPTISGTGAEASRTCVLINKEKNIKLGMNSPFSIYDELILDPQLTATVPKNQFFYTAMDTYIHCIESLNGRFRNILADEYSIAALKLVREVFESKDIMAPECLEKLMLASFLGGSAIGNSLVGLVHPLSAGLSTVFGTHHCLANCLVMKEMIDFYPKETREFLNMIDRHEIEFPKFQFEKVELNVLQKIFESVIKHERPLENALGNDYRQIANFDLIASIFTRILEA